MIPAFPNWSVIYTKLSWVEIGTFAAKKRLQMFHTEFEQEKKRLHLSEGDPSCIIVLMHHWEAKLEEGVNNKTMPASSVRLTEVAMNALDTLQKAFYHVCSLPNH